MRFEEWSLSGYYGKLVASQANNLELPNLDGIYDVSDIGVNTDGSDKRLTGEIGCITMRYALSFISNYGMFGHLYRIVNRNDGRHWTIRL